MAVVPAFKIAVSFFWPGWMLGLSFVGGNRQKVIGKYGYAQQIRQRMERHGDIAYG